MTTDSESGDTACPLRDRAELWSHLERLGLSDWAGQLRSEERNWFAPQSHGTLPKWLAAHEQLPILQDSNISVSGGVVDVAGQQLAPLDMKATEACIKEFHPWRKGPFRFFGIDVDTEWRSNLKWDRLANAVEFTGKSVLDVGCGNGYYGWRMLDAGAEFVLGCEPFKLYAMQFELARKYAVAPQKHFVVPAGDTDLPANLNAFDITFSMGVLYHRPNPIDHLQRMRSTLNRDGRLVLETIVIDEPGSNVLTPESRYAKMRNVWFIPTVDLLCTWMCRSGFRDVELIDVSTTTNDEQRSTEWMTFESLADFLDPIDSTRTIEGYPAPARAILSARCK